MKETIKCLRLISMIDTNLVKDEWYHQIEDLINHKEKETFMKMLNCQLLL